jgi:hypothetical protein
MLIQIFELTKIRAQHHRYFSDKNSPFIILKNDIFNLALSLACLRTVIKVVVEFLFAEFYISVDLCAVSKISHSSFMGENRHHTIISLHNSGCYIDMYLVKFHFIYDVFVSLPILFVAHSVLWLHFYLNFSVL